MARLKIVASNDIDARIPPSIVAKYYPGEVNRCPACGGKAWEVGRLYAECTSSRSRIMFGRVVDNVDRCGFALAIAPK
jgi:hypothetical protein